MTGRLVVRCAQCGVQWDVDYDPPACTDPEHEHELRNEGDV